MRLSSSILLIVCLGLFLACAPVFSPGDTLPDGDIDGDDDWEEDGDTDGDGDEDGDIDDEWEQDGDIDGDGDEDGDNDTDVYNLRLSPDFLRVGGRVEEGTITFRNIEDVRRRLAEAPRSFPSWQIDYGKDITFLLVRFDPEELRFYDIEMVASSTARTGARIVSARITYGDVTIIEHGEFYVLPALEGANSPP